MEGRTESPLHPIFYSRLPFCYAEAVVAQAVHEGAVFALEYSLFVNLRTKPRSESLMRPWFVFELLIVCCTCQSIGRIGSLAFAIDAASAADIIGVRSKWAHFLFLSGTFFVHKVVWSGHRTHALTWPFDTHLRDEIDENLCEGWEGGRYGDSWIECKVQ